MREKGRDVDERALKGPKCEARAGRSHGGPGACPRLIGGALVVWRV